MNVSLDRSEGSLPSDDTLDTEDEALDTGDELDVNVDELDTPDEADLHGQTHTWVHNTNVSQFAHSPESQKHKHTHVVCIFSQKCAAKIYICWNVILKNCDISAVFVSQTEDSEESDQGAGAASSDAIAGHRAAEESRDGRLWRSVVIGEQEHRIDMKCIEPYKRVISHGGMQT